MKSVVRRRFVTLGIALGLTACGGESQPAEPTAAPATEPTQTPTDPSAAPEQAAHTPTPTSASVATGCPATDPTNLALPGTVHPREVNSAQTWTLAGSPHRLPDGLSIDAPGVVTIEPCARVVVGDGREIWVGDGGTLIAMGREGEPILFDAPTPDSARGLWQGVQFAGGARPTSKLHHVIIEDAGGHDSYTGAIYLSDGFVLDAQHVRVVRSARDGIFVGGTARFAPGSTDVTVTESGNPDAITGPVHFERAQSVGSLPEGSYRGNASDEILVDDDVVTTSATWRNPGEGVRYRLVRGLNVGGSAGPILTIAPGTTLAFAPETTLFVGYGEDGGLVLDGRDEAGRIVLASARSVPSAGDWGGIHFGQHLAAAATKLSFVTIRHAGRADGYDEAGCDEGPAAITITGRDLGARIDHVRFEQLDPSSFAIARGFDAATSTDYTDAALGNDFGGGQRCRQSRNRDADGNCPDPLPPCE